ncbi:nuclear pore complex protein Nup160 [Nerophis lumbriciformis]|uniref:nuclear pore complex protein Nup160 n=1 Tax=Nerophis lumbriciformis TaxID=546530 RepID=UPI003BA8E798
MAAALERSFIEICGFEREPVQRFREVHLKSVSTPAPGALKFPDTAGAFHYDDGGKAHSITSNRFISWSTSGDTLQLVEQSLDTNLLNSAIRLRFIHCNVVPGGVSILETPNNVVVLIATNRSVHRMVLPHPKRMYRSELVTELHMQSIFTDVAKLNLQDACHSAAIPSALTPAGSVGAATAWLTHQGDANYALASPAGGIMVITLPAHGAQGGVTVVELKRSSMKRRLSVWMPSAIMGDQTPADLVVSLAVRELEDDSIILALCQDHKLRMWSFRDQACLLEADMLDYMPASKRVKRLAGLGHRLRLTSCAASGLCLAVYLAAPHRGQFIVLQLVPTDNNRYSLDHISSLFSTQETVVDFTLTSTDIWALWLDDSNSSIVKYINYEHNTAGQWNQVFVQPPPEDEVHVGVDQDPRETYLEVLFSPLGFTAAAIFKALQIFRRGPDVMTDMSWEGLKKEVTLAVESELQSSVTEFEFSQEEYRQLQVEFWSKFYACCLQYQEVLSMPLALSVSPHSHMVCLLKKGFVSFLLPCLAVDHLYLSSDDYFLCDDDTLLTEDAEVGRGVATLVTCLRLLSDAVSPDMAYEMEKALEHAESPERTAELILENMLSHDNQNVMEDIQNKLQDIRNPMAAMLLLLRELDLETDLDFEESPLLPGQTVSVRLSLSQLYASTTAVSLVCQALSHMTMTRALLCRDLLLLLKLCLRLGDHVLAGGGAQLLQIQQEVIPRASHLLSSYFLLKHVSQSLSCPVADDTLDANLQHLTALDLSDSPCLVSKSTALSPQTLVELFYQTSARKMILSQIFSQNSDPSAGGPVLIWTDMISNVVQLLAQLLWPINPSFHFPECLMANCQYTQLQEYVRLIGPWCLVNIGSCRFLLAQCYLANGEGHKALQCFHEAAAEVEKEEFLIKLTGGGYDEVTCTPRLHYYNKVLRLLEDVGLPELVIQLATLALAEAVNDVNSQAALWTRIFKHHLDLGHNSDAYEALIQNPDSSMQLDCLRQLVVVLCERAQLHDLVHFSYVNLHDEVVSIMESRARGLDLLSHNYYELLYAFHINRHNYRKAGSVMLELGMRLGREVPSVVGLKKQVNCFLAAINCLRLIRPQYAWMLQPAWPPQGDRPGASPKRNSDGDFVSRPVKRQVDILEIKDVEKEYALARCRLTLAEHHPPSAAIAGGASAAELVRLLLDCGLFTCASRLCHTFKVPLTSLFEALTYRCIKLQFGGEESQNEAWLWLSANQLSSVVNTKESSAVDEAWRLLASFLERFPSANGIHHRCVLTKLLSHGMPPPDWLVKSFKEVDAAALLRLYLNFDLLDAAAELVIEYVDALLGRGHQYFGIKAPLSATAPCVWLPYTSIDQLMVALKETQTNVIIYNKLRDKLSDYHKLVDQTTEMRLANI